VEHELVTLPEHLSSHSTLCWVCVALSIVFRVMFCIALFLPFFLLAIVLSLRRITASLPITPLVYSKCS
jgi:hypothetical protein